MLLLLPPSETKRSGGEGPPLDIPGLALSGLRAPRAATVAALVALSEDPERAVRVLKLSERRRGEVALNAAVREAPTMAAVDRYTGVLYDALDAGGLSAGARRWLGEHALIHSAPFGPVGALDAIPAYRLAAGTALPGIPPLRRLWADAVSAALAQEQPGFVLDLRSEAYVALGPVPPAVPAAFARIVTEGADGTVRALNHFNKHAKGTLARALAEAGANGEIADIRSPDAFVRWSRGAGWDVRAVGSEIHVVV